jgi:hypothetical protein
MKFTATDVSRIAAQAAREVSSQFAVTGVTISGGDTGYSEVHVSSADTADRGHLLLSVFRNLPEDAIRHDVTAQLRAHLRDHPQPGTDEL